MFIAAKIEARRAIANGEAEGGARRAEEEEG
jgi:hypothetical protein